jgi:hypothetical protein
MRSLLLSLLVLAPAYADQSVPPPRPAPCAAAHPNVVREIERLLKIAGGHASHSSVCSDGDGHRSDVKLLETCALPRELDAGMVRRFWLRYRVTTTFEVGGECSPYPDCAKPGPPETSTHTVVLDFGDFPPGLRITVPASLPGLTLKTPLHKKHSTGCNGDVPRFEPTYVRLTDLKK